MPETLSCFLLTCCTACLTAFDFKLGAIVDRTHLITCRPVTDARVAHDQPYVLVSPLWRDERLYLILCMFR